MKDFPILKSESLRKSVFQDLPQGGTFLDDDCCLMLKLSSGETAVVLGFAEGTADSAANRSIKIGSTLYIGQLKQIHPVEAKVVW